MGVLQDSLNRTLRGLPQLVLKPLVEKKLEERGVSDTNLADRIVTAILDGDDDSDEVDIDLPFDLEFSEADNSNLQQSAADLFDDIPEMIEAVGRKIGRSITDEIYVQWQANVSVVAEEREKLRQKIASRWGEAFSDLRLLLEVCAGYGDNFNHAQRKSRRKRNGIRNEVLGRLHIRACRIAEEIILLLENGHTEGAEARWRTLLEVSVTARLIAEGGDALAERYLDHEAVDRKKVLDDHDRAAEARASEPARISAVDRKEIEREFARVTRQYGSSFRGMYGWAAGQLGLGEQPQFHSLQEVAGVLAMKLEYRLACFGTHASPRKLNQPLHEWDPTLHIPGVFSAGFENPGTNTAYTLVQITFALFDEPWDLDKLVEFRVMGFIRDDVEMKLSATARSIEREEQRVIARASRQSSPRMPLRRSKFGRP